eukprot:1195673-Prorocentrum_minimum.AAC.3
MFRASVSAPASTSTYAAPSRPAAAATMSAVSPLASTASSPAPPFSSAFARRGREFRNRRSQ